MSYRFVDALLSIKAGSIELSTVLMSPVYLPVLFLEANIVYGIFNARQGEWHFSVNCKTLVVDYFVRNLKFTRQFAFQRYHFIFILYLRSYYLTLLVEILFLWRYFRKNIVIHSIFMSTFWETNLCWDKRLKEIELNLNLNLKDYWWIFVV